MSVNLKYADVLAALGMPNEVVGIFTGAVKLPIGSAEQPPGSYGFPPALIPLWSSGPIYHGLWKHWFVKRSPVFVRMSLEAECAVVEYARSPLQLVERILVDAICLADGVNDEVEGFARAVQVADLGRLDQVTLDSGDEASGVLALDEFAGNPPAECVNDSVVYRGEFPVAGVPLGSEAMASMSPFELGHGWKHRRGAPSGQPAWFRAGGSQSELFEQRLADGRLGECWLALNSPGWTFADAKAAVRRLADAAPSPAFDLLAAAWCAENNAQLNGY